MPSFFYFFLFVYLFTWFYISTKVSLLSSQFLPLPPPTAILTPPRYQPTMAFQVAVRLGSSSSTKAGGGNPIRGMGP